MSRKSTLLAMAFLAMLGACDAIICDKSHYWLYKYRVKRGRIYDITRRNFAEIAYRKAMALVKTTGSGVGACTVVKHRPKAACYKSWRPGGPGRQSLGQYGFTSVVKLSCPFLKSTVYKKVDVSVYTRRDFSYWYPMATLFY
ncbi:expressed protein [Chlorella variabilis]|uniref:Expressed protein n=1 Tax=Chlorella variabilis TaxID=554065 RepID=E1ZR75_CHLVA|nr:expressed protein [Chlorella variabilis]EFN51730.1 expressed protein [Chlorella variabilis]|eukprot:XP_005843832.1 expressed protein [Chlorella variabilis]